jgi:YVTN family beta-propeller protein
LSLSLVLGGAWETGAASLPHRLGTHSIAGSSAYDFGLNPATNRGYLTSSDTNRLSVIDLATNTETAAITLATPRGIAVNTMTNRVYVTLDGPDLLQVIDGATNALITTVGVGADPIQALVDEASNLIYVSNTGANTVSVVDGATNSVVATIVVQAAPTGMALNPATQRLYVSNGNSNSVSVVNTATNLEIATIPVGVDPDGIALKPSANRMFVGNWNSASSSHVSVIDTITNSVVTTIPGLTGPVDVAYFPATDRLYIANYGFGETMTVVDASSLAVLGQVAVNGTPHRVALHEAAMRIYTPNLLSTTYSVFCDDAADTDSDGVGNGCDNCPITYNPTQVDTDGDSLGDFCDDCGSDPLNSSSRPERVDGPFAGVDDDGDTQVDEPLPPAASAFDCDGDGWTGAQEEAVFDGSGGRDQDPCGNNGWPAELNSGVASVNKVTLSDIGSFHAPVGHFNTSVGTYPADERWDLIPNGLIELQDIGAIHAGATAMPAMLGGALIFNGPECPWPP